MKIIKVLPATLILVFAIQASAETLPMVPGESIGPATLGMSEQEIEEINTSLPCAGPIKATFKENRAVTLSTNCAGKYAIQNSLLMGAELNRVVAKFGKPNNVILDQEYENAVALWIRYDPMGIAFRVLANEYGNFVQSILIFAKTCTIATCI